MVQVWIFFLLLLLFKRYIWCVFLVKLSCKEMKSEMNLQRGVRSDLQAFGGKRESFPPLPLFNWSQAGVYANERRPEVARVNSGGWWGATLAPPFPRARKARRSSSSSRPEHAPERRPPFSARLFWMLKLKSLTGLQDDLMRSSPRHKLYHIIATC